jgi:hypothetical protein
MEDKPIPRWQKLIALGYVVAIVAEVVVFRTRLHADFIPFDNSHIAPNILASILIVELVTPFAVLLWPPTRRRLHRFIDRKIAPLHEKLDHHAKIHSEIKASLEELHRKHDELAKKL